MMSDFLNWRMDPFLLDPVPTAKNEWLTANKLIEQQKQSKIFLKSNNLNLYSIMVRKHDFLAGERLLQRFPYVSLPSELALNVRKQSLSLAERCHHYFIETAINYSIKKWQAKLIDYLENQKRLPFPLFRMSDHWHEFLKQERVQFQSSRGEHFHLPTLLTGDLAYFLGVVIGDGHLNYHNIELVDFSQEHMLMLQALAKRLFGIEGTISGEKKIWLLHLNNKWLVRLVNFLTNQPITGKKYHTLREPLIFVLTENLRWEFWSGVLDADGCYKSQIDLCSSSKQFIEEFGEVLDSYNIKYKIREIRSQSSLGFSLGVKAKYKNNLSHYLHPRHPIKQKDFSHYLHQKKAPLSNIQPFERLYIYQINPQTLVNINDTTFFNFELLPMLNVTNCSNYLRIVRNTNHWTQQDLADYLEIPKGRLASYEYRSNLPINSLRKLLPLLPDSPPHLMFFLKHYNHQYFRSRKTLARLDLEPDSSLLSILKSLIICRDYIIVQCEEEEKKRIYTELRNRFKLAIVKTNTIQNSVLYQYINTFFLLTTEQK